MNDSEVLGMDEVNPAYAKEVGARLRDIRRQQGLSLQAVAETSQREFKASVLGAYERGERMISVLRLQRLAQIYGVPVDQLLPRPAGSRRTTSTEARPVVGGPLKLDLVRLESTEFPERELIRRYVGMIQIQRGDFNGRIITIREEDVRSLARVLEAEEADLRSRLDELGLCL
jgi:transcriptional regulator with XRE-family HTH domain